MKQTPAQKLGLPPSGSQKSENGTFITVAWIVAWLILGGSVLLAASYVSMADSRWGAEADRLFALAITSAIGGAFGFVICGGIAIVVEHLSDIRKKLK